MCFGNSSLIRCCNDAVRRLLRIVRCQGTVEPLSVRNRGGSVQGAGGEAVTDCARRRKKISSAAGGDLNGGRSRNVGHALHRSYGDGRRQRIDALGVASVRSLKDTVGSSAIVVNLTHRHLILGSDGPLRPLRSLRSRWSLYARDALRPLRSTGSSITVFASRSLRTGGSRWGQQHPRGGVLVWGGVVRPLAGGNGDVGGAVVGHDIVDRISGRVVEAVAKVEAGSVGAVGSLRTGRALRPLVPRCSRYARDALRPLRSTGSSITVFASRSLRTGGSGWGQQTPSGGILVGGGGVRPLAGGNGDVGGAVVGHDIVDRISGRVVETVAKVEAGSVGAVGSLRTGRALRPLWSRWSLYARDALRPLRSTGSSITVFASRSLRTGGSRWGQQHPRGGVLVWGGVVRPLAGGNGDVGGAVVGHDIVDRISGR